MRESKPTLIAKYSVLRGESRWAPCMWWNTCGMGGERKEGGEIKERGHD